MNTLNRRGRWAARLAAALLAVTAIVVAPQVAGASTTARPAATVKPTVVLVHGAWADGSSWAPVAKGLQLLGYPVAVAPNPLRGVAADSAYLDAYLHSIEGPIVLVGHSYGGFLITNAATGNPAVKALVYVNAFAPDAGESIASLTAAVPGSELAGPPETIFNHPVPIPNGGGNVDLYVQTTVFIHAFTNGLNTIDARALAASQRPLAGSAVTEVSGVPAWKTIPSWYVEGSQDRVIPPHGQEFMANRAGAKLTTIDAGHLSMLTKPVAVIAVIASAAKATN